MLVGFIIAILLVVVSCIWELKRIEKEEKIELPFALQTDDVESDDIIGW